MPLLLRLFLQYHLIRIFVELSSRLLRSLVRWMAQFSRAYLDGDARIFSLAAWDIKFACGWLIRIVACGALASLILWRDHYATSWPFLDVDRAGGSRLYNHWFLLLSKFLRRFSTSFLYLFYRATHILIWVFVRNMGDVAGSTWWTTSTMLALLTRLAARR